MKKFRLLALAIILLTCTAGLRAQTFAEGSIRHTLGASVAAWNRGDVAGFMQSYEDSPETTFIGKSIEHGYQNILARYKRTYATPEAMGKLAFSDLQVRVLDTHYAIATGRFNLHRSAQGGGDATGVFSLMLQKTAEGWRIILDHTS